MNGELKCIGAIRIAEETITGTTFLSKCIITALQNSRENPQQLPCFARTQVLTNTQYFCAQYIGSGTLRYICCLLLLVPLS
jgi:hypothetical protein